jgi:peptidoglycan/LPS O-acetylase OafA/YrhL
VPLAVVVREARQGFRADVEGLRAAAVLLVVGYHVWLGRVSGGVDVFLLLSAYFLVGGLVRRLERGERVSLPRQWLRILQRLVPAAVVVVTGTVLTGLVLLPQPRWRGLLVDAAGSMAYSENWVLAARAVDYYAADKGQASPLQHMWSLSVQGQAFVLVPVLVVGAGWLARRWGRSPAVVVAVVLGLVAAASLAWSVHTTATRQAFAYFDTASRVWELALGGLLAVLLPRVRLPRGVAEPLGWLGLGALLACGMVLDVTRSFPGWVALWPLGCAAAVLLAGARPTRWGVDRLLSTRPLVAAGGVSYALYLVHWPVLVLWLATSGRERAGLLDGAVVVAASVLLAVALARLVERPVRRRDPSAAAPWRTAGVVVGSAVLVAGLAGGGILRIDRDAQRGDRLSAGHEVPGYPGARAVTDGGAAPTLPVAQRLPASTALRREFASLPGPCTGEWEAPAALGDTCSALDPGRGASATVLVVGDSHAEQWLAALTPPAEREGWRVVALLEGGCSFGAAATRSGTCARWNAAALDYVTSHPADLVVTVATAAHRTRPTERLVTGYEEVVRAVTAGGTPVVGLRDNPRFTGGVVSCALAQGDAACTAPVSEKLAATNPAEALAVRGFSALDLTDLVCPAGRCPPAVGNVWVYLDDNHLTRSYAATLAPALEERLRAAGVWPGDGRVLEAGATLSR